MVLKCIKNVFSGGLNKKNVVLLCFLFEAIKLSNKIIYLV